MEINAVMLHNIVETLPQQKYKTVLFTNNCVDYLYLCAL